MSKKNRLGLGAWWPLHHQALSEAAVQSGELLAAQAAAPVSTPIMPRHFCTPGSW